MHSPLTVTVTDLHPVTPGGNLRAFATVRLEPWRLTMRGVKVVQQAGQKAYVSLPQQQDSRGNWRPTLTTDDDSLKAAISAAVLAAWTANAPKP